MKNLAFADQLAAAVRDTAHVFEAAGVDERDVQLPADTISWFEDALQAVLTGLRTGGTLRCSHLTASPSPVVWAAWRPGSLLCTPCADKVVAKVRGTAYARMCSCCRETSSATARVLGMWGPLTATFTLCPNCRTDAA